MSYSNEPRRYFCHFALGEESGYLSTSLETILGDFKYASHEPYRAREFEQNIEAKLRNNARDPNHDRAWRGTGVKGGREEAARMIRQAYLDSVPEAIKSLSGFKSYDGPQFIPSALGTKDGTSMIEALFENFKRANLENTNASEYLLTDEAWQEVGFENPAAFQTKLRAIFTELKVGGYVAGEIGETEIAKCDGLSENAADYAIQKYFPELADKLGVPKNIKDGLVAKPSVARANVAGQAFGQALDFN